MNHAVTVCLGILLALPLGTAMAQEDVNLELTPAENQEINLDTYVELLREDVRSQKVAILGQLMGLSPDEAAKFWPVYSEYDKELTVVADERVAAIKNYAADYWSLSDAKASELGRKALELEARRNAIKTKYFERVEKVLSGKHAAKFLQIENQLLKIVDLQILASLPIVQ